MRGVERHPPPGWPRTRSRLVMAPHRGSLRPGALLLALVAILSSACGARLTDEQMAAALGASPAAAQAGTGSVTETTTVSGAATSATGATAGAAGTSGSGATGGSSGAAPGSGGAAAPEGAAVAGTCTPQPSDEVGVTDTEIVLGNVSTISGPIAGFGTTGVNGTRAYIEYVNSLGGVCGRQLRLSTADDRLDTAANRSEAERLSADVFGFVGGTSVVDAGTAAVLEGTNIASAGLTVGNPAIESPNVFSSNPIDPTNRARNTTPIWNYFKATRGVTRVAVVYPAQADARARAMVFVEDIRAAGLEVDGPYEVSLTETNYVGVAQQIENHGADGVITALEITGMSRLAQAFAQIDYQPRAAYYGAQGYGQQFLELAGDAANGTSLGIAYSIFEDAPTNPTVATFLEWYQRVAPGSTPDFFSIVGWASTDMFVQALEAAGPAPTRDAVLTFLQSLTSFDAHGLIASCNPAGKLPADGFAIVNVVDGQWVREYPASGFATG